MNMQTDIQDAFLLGVSCAKYIAGIKGDLSAPSIDVLQQIADKELTLVDSPSEMSSKFPCTSDFMKLVAADAARDHRLVHLRLARKILALENVTDDVFDS